MDTNSEKQFEACFKELAKNIFRFIYFKVSEYELAQDLTEEVFIRYWKRLKEKKSIKNPKALLYFIAKGLVIDHYRTKKNNKKQSLEEIDERLLSIPDGIADSIAKKQELEQIYATIKKLRSEYQEILFLHFVEDLSVKEIACIQKKKENAVRVFLHRAVKELKKKI